MGTGILVCGLNGCGKSTLGAALAKELGFHFIDNEQLYFPGTDPRNPYAAPRTRAEAEQMLFCEIDRHENFIFAAVRGDYGENITDRYHYAVYLEVPRDTRLQRIRNRSFCKFGSRMLSGGDLYEQEEAFFRMAEKRSEDYVENWLKTLHCPILYADGTAPTEDTVQKILTHFPLLKQL